MIRTYFLSDHNSAGISPFVITLFGFNLNKRSHSRRLLAPFASLFLLLSSHVPAQETRADVPLDSNSKCVNTQQMPANTIDAITINVHPVFDEHISAENNWIFRTVNRLHINTHTDVVKNDLLFKEGDVLDEKNLMASERILRTRRYLNSASVVAVQDCNQTEVKVDVREVWTLLPEVSFSHTGGKNNSSVGLHDSNFLGLGKTLNIIHSNSVLRSSNLLEYYDPNTGIADSNLSLQYSDNSDGTHRAAALIKPFIALSTTWSGGISYEKYTQEDTLYNAGNEADRFGHNNNNFSFFYGEKLNLGDSESVHRILLGYTHWEDNFMPVGAAPTTSVFVPDNRAMNYPWVEYQHVIDGFIEARNIRQINRIEDINLGTETHLRIGYVTSPFDAFNHALLLNASLNKGFAVSERQLLLTTLTASSFYGKDNQGTPQFYNGVIQANAAYHWQDFNRGQFFIGLTQTRGFQLFKDMPLELGGDTGLRGYPIRYQAGDHLHLLTLEQRFFGEREWFSLFHMGAAVFYDEGRVWGDTAIAQTQQSRLRDFGIGLRFSATRTGNLDEGSHNIVHLDLASPLDGDNHIAKVQWLIKVKKNF